MPALGDFRVLTFDCYGTLIDWEGGIQTALLPWLGREGVSVGRDETLELFARFESAQEAETPDMLYPEVLARVHGRLARHWGVCSTREDARRFGESVGQWPAFPDSAAALGHLKRHYELVILSNVDRESFRDSNALLGVTFDAVFTAQDIGSYKPDPRNFEHMIARLGESGVEPSEILHTAQSIYHDHEPATRLGLATNWIDRRHDRAGWGATLPPAGEARIDFRHDSMADFVEQHRLELEHGVRP
jgi:2-haloacid dehalogenase